jgi:hypothetical protein
MAVVPSSITVAPDSTGKKVDNVQVTTTEGDVQRQVSSLGDPENPDGYAAVKNATPASDAYGVVVRLAVPIVDTGLVALTDTFSHVIATTVLGRLLWLVNLTDTIQQYSVTDGNDLEYAIDASLQPREVKPIPLHGMKFVNGVKWKAGATTSVNAQFVGD